MSESDTRMSSDGDELTAEGKTDRIEALLEELHSQEREAFLEIQFASLEAVYQSYPRNHNVTGLTDEQREALGDLIDEYDLKIIFEDGDGEATTVTATHDSEPTATEHMEILEAIVDDVYGISFGDATLAFLSSGGPDDAEPLLWTDVELEGDAE